MIRYAPSIVLIILLVLSSCAGTPPPQVSEPVGVVTPDPVPAEGESPAGSEDIPLTMSPSPEKAFELPVPRAAVESPPVYPWKPGTDRLPAVPFMEIMELPPGEAAEEALYTAAADTADGGRDVAAIPAGTDRPQGVAQEPVAVERERPADVREEPPAEEPVSDAYDLGSLEAEAGVPFDYSIEGEGWIFGGSDPEGVRFIRRTVPGGYTEFTLSAPENGTYRLHFIYNNILEERAENAVLTLRLGMVPETEADAWVEEPEQPEEQVVIPPSPGEIVALGFYEALSEADAAVKAGDPGRALEILRLCAGAFQDSRNLDRVYFAMASIYEDIGPFRDINLAVSYYRKIIDTFPASIFYNRAHDRIVYLERNFIRIR